MSSTTNFHEMIREKRIVELDGGRNGPLDRGASNNFLEVSNNCARFTITQQLINNRVEGRRQGSSREVFRESRGRCQLQHDCTGG